MYSTSTSFNMTRASKSLTCIYFSTVTQCINKTSSLKVKGTAIPLLAWTGPEGSRRLSFSDFKTVGTWRW